MPTPHASGLDLASWQNAIFAIPLAVSAVLLILSSIRLGGHHAASAHGAHAGLGGHAHAGGFGGHGHAGFGGHGHGAALGHGAAAPAHPGSPASAGHSGPGVNGHGHVAGPAHHGASQAVKDAGRVALDAASASAAAAAHVARQGVEAVQAAGAPLPGKHEGPTMVAVLGSIFGIGRAPILMVVELFMISWGFLGLLVNEMLLDHGHRGPTGVILLSAPIAFFGGLVLARLGAAALDRTLPREETWVVSHQALFGLTGEVTYEVTASSGRIHVYDAYGTLHDESCRIAEGSDPIARGCSAIVEDMDPSGKLIVREVAL